VYTHMSRSQPSSLIPRTFFVLCPTAFGHLTTGRLVKMVKTSHRVLFRTVLWVSDPHLDEEVTDNFFFKLAAGCHFMMLGPAGNKTVTSV